MIIKQRIKVVVIVVLTSLLLASCATTVNMSQQSREKIKRVSINPHVVVPKNVNYVGTGKEMGGFLGGAIGSIAGNVYDESRHKRIEQLMISHNIHIGEIVKAQFIQQIKQKNLFTISKDGDAVLNIIVRSYGLSVPNAFSTELRPIMYLVVNLTNKQHQVIWQQHRFIKVLFNDCPKHSFEEITAHPKYLTYMWNAAANEAVSDILRSL